MLVRVRPADPAGLAVARREVAIAGALGACAVPVTDLVEPADQPWMVDGAVVTAWRWVDAVGTATPADLGRLARVLRERTAGWADDLPALDPLRAAVGAVADLPGEDPEAGFVRDRAAELRDAWAVAASEDPLGPSIVHGDLHAGNVVVTSEGPLLTDLELSGRGPASYDLAPAVVAVERYGADPGSLEAFLAATGGSAELVGSAEFATFVAVYELWVTAWAVGVRAQDPSWALEARRRVATLRDGDDSRWTLR